MHIVHENGLIRHNFYRNIHNASNLTLDSKITRIAQSFAEKLASHGDIVKTGNLKYGENIYEFCSSTHLNLSNSKSEFIYYFILSYLNLK